MNPPSALYGAMNKERKPFTYTPGGLDLSEIKSERMAKRLIRNAMNQGVPEQPVSYIQSPPTPSAINVPNFNCLPVQVFPTFPLPINPKTLLKSRNNQQKEPCEDDSLHLEQTKTNIKPNSANQIYVNNNNNLSKYISSDFDNKSFSQSLPPLEYNTALPGHYCPRSESGEHAEKGFEKKEIDKEIKSSPAYEPTIKLFADITNLSLLTTGCGLEKPVEKLEEVMGTVNNQNEVKAVKSELKIENDTADQNGDTSVDAAVTVKLPGKKSSAKTETKVEVVKKVLSDGSTEEIKTTTTRTTIDGKTEITTKTETTIIPKEDDLEDEEYVEEEEEEEEQDIAEDEEQKVVENHKKDIDKNIINEEIKDQESFQNICKEEESVVSTVTENVVITASTESQENSEEEDVEEKENAEEIQNDIKIDESVKDEKVESEVEDEEIVEEEEDINNEDEKRVQSQPDDAVIKVNELEVETQEEVPSAIDFSSESKEENEEKLNNDRTKDDKEEIMGGDTGTSQVNNESTPKESCTLSESKQSEESNKETENQAAQSSEENKEEIIITVQVLKPNLSGTEEISTTIKENDIKSNYQTERNIPLREPSVPLEKVEDVEIKPIGQIISKSHSENTEIITTSIDKPTTGLSTQTAYNRIENIVTVNRTTKTLDHAYEQIEPLSIPTSKTYFQPTADALPISAQPSKLYQPVYQSDTQNERRHSLLLDRLSVDRQMPSADLYHSNYQSANQNYEQNQWTQEPQSEVLTVSNVKPSTITKNQQWYQQTKKEDISYNHTAPPSVNLPSQQWYSQQVQSQPLPPSQIRPEYQPQPQFQSTYVDKNDILKGTTNNFSSSPQNLYPNYTPKPTSWGTNKNNSTQTTPNINLQPSSFSYPGIDPVDSYQKPQQFSSSYIPPPWEQDSTYVPENQNQNYYPSQSNTKFASSVVDPPTWTPSSTNSKFSKPKPTSYIPPAPNQSFVKPVVAVEPPKLPGRKTYYSEYERRYISVPESTYIPTENKYQAQPDPSPKYYYDNNEPVETVEHEWRKELREFSEKTQSQIQSEQISVKPPWEEDPKFYVPKVATEYTPTPTWSQTLRPNSWRERSFESEFVRSKEMPRTNTLGRGRPQSSYVKSNISASIPERVRGVSVDRYNPNNYKSPVPSEYPPVQSHTLDPSIGAKTYHNPNVPAYHSRASAEPREQTVAYPQARQWGESRAPPVQSRSFKYLQWITGTED